VTDHRTDGYPVSTYHVSHALPAPIQLIVVTVLLFALILYSRNRTFAVSELLLDQPLPATLSFRCQRTENKIVVSVDELLMCV
jgi:hypothetical protein